MGQPETSLNPSITPHDEEIEVNLDVEIRKLKRALPELTAQNISWCFYNDPLCYSTAAITSAVIQGHDYRVTSKKERDMKKIKQFNNKINFYNSSIEDLFNTTWADALKFGVSFWRPWKTNEMESGVDLSRISPSTLSHVIHPEKGYSMYIQEAETWATDEMETFADFVDKFHLGTVARKWIKVKIPDDIQNIVKFQFFDEAPMKSVAHLVIYKKWIEWYMRKHAQKYWSPFTIFYMGSEKFVPPPGEYMKRKSEIDTIIPNMYNFSGVSVPGWVRAEQMRSTSQTDSTLYTTILDWINHQILYSLFASMQMRDASGKEGKGASLEVTRTWITFIENIRGQYDRTLRNFYAKVVIGDGDPEDIEIHWSPIKADSLLDISAAIERIIKTGQVDQGEVRRALTMAFPFIDPDKKDIKPITTMEEKLAKLGKENKPPGENKDLKTQESPEVRPTPVRNKDE